jgi:hypothetical protein
MVAVTVAFFALVASPMITAPQALAAQAQKAPGSRVAIMLPRDYEVSTLFQGFMSPASRTSIVLFEVPAEAYDGMAKGLTKEGLAKKQITDVAPGKLNRADAHVYLTGVQAHPTGPVFKYVLLIRNETHAALITANVPKSSVDEGLVARDVLVQALESAVLEAEAAPSNDPFVLAYLGPFKEAANLAASAKLYTEDGHVMPAKTGDVRNAVIVAPSINRLPVTDPAAYAKRAWAGLQGYDQLAITSEAPVSVDGLEGYRINGKGNRTTSQGSVPVFVHQVFLRRKEGGHFRLIMTGRMADEARLLPELEKIVAGFKVLR